MAYTARAHELVSYTKSRFQIEDEFKKLAKQSKREAELTITSLQRILQGQSNKRNVG
jgi:hypothetical protein